MTRKLRYWRGLTPDNKQGLADDIGYTRVHLSGVFNGRIPAGTKLIEELVKRTGLTKHDFRPDLFDKGE